MTVLGIRVLLILLLAPTAWSCEVQKLAFAAGKEFFAQGQYLLGIQEFALAAQSDCDRLVKDQSSYYMAYGAFRLDDPQLSRYKLVKVKQSTSEKVRQKALLLDSLISNEIRPELSEANKENLKFWFDRKQIKEPSADQHFQEWQKLYNEMAKKEKSVPVAVGLSSVIPGLGQAYAGAYQSALLSFAINSIFGLAAYELWRKDLPATAVAATAVFSVTYVGNILSAAKATAAHNRALYQNLDERYLREHFRVRNF